MTTLAQEVDTKVMERFATAKVEDLERGLAYTMGAVVRCQRDHHFKVGREFLHHAELLRAEIARRKMAP